MSGNKVVRQRFFVTAFMGFIVFGDKRVLDFEPPPRSCPDSMLIDVLFLSVVDAHKRLDRIDDARAGLLDVLERNHGALLQRLGPGISPLCLARRGASG